MEKQGNFNLQRLIDESINLEHNVSELYLYFSKIFPDHAPFWKKLSDEEINHANLIKFAKQELAEYGLFPFEILTKNIDILLETINDISQFITSHPSVESAFAFATKIEESAAEMHFQNTVKAKPKSLELKLFTELCGNDKDHASRIRKYAKAKGIDYRR